MEANELAVRGWINTAALPASAWAPLASQWAAGQAALAAPPWRGYPWASADDCRGTGVSIFSPPGSYRASHL